MKRLLIRMRASAGHLGLLALLTVLAGTLVVGAPRFANQLTDESLREYIGALPQLTQEVTYLEEGFLDQFPDDAADVLVRQRELFDPALRDRIGTSWFTVTAKGVGLKTGLPSPAEYSLRNGNGLRDATRLVDGRRPDNSVDSSILEVMVSQRSAARLKQKLGSEFAIGRREKSVRVRIVGIFAAHDEDGPIWHTEPLVLSAYVPQADGESYKAIFLTDESGLGRVAGMGMPAKFEWRYRLDLSRLDMTSNQAMIDAAIQARQQGIYGSGQTGLPTAFSKFIDSARAGEALVAVVQSGTLATLAGLVLLVAHLAVARRRTELVLLRARGGAIMDIGTRVLNETLPIIPPAAALGWWLGTLVPGRAASTDVLLLSFATLALVATPALALSSLRRFSFAAERDDLSKARVGLKRRTAEFSLLVLAAVGIWLLRRRGLSTSDDVDIYLISVPVLLAAGTAMLVLRLLPMPIGWASRLAARGRSVVAFLGLARAGRAAPATIGPIAVLVVAVCTAVFSIGVAGTVDSGRDRATDHEIVADAVVKGYFFAPDTVDALRKAPGVTGVAPFVVQPTTDLYTSAKDGILVGQFYLVIVDGPAFAELAKARNVSIDSRIAGATATTTPGILVSPLAAEKLKGRTEVAAAIRGQLYDLQVAGVVDTFPGVPRTAGHFVIVPWQALQLRNDDSLNPTGFLVNGDFDQAAVVAAGNAGQIRWLGSYGMSTEGFEPVTKVGTWAAHRQKLEQTGVNSVLSFAYGIGAAGGIALALLAVGFSALAGARTRGRVLSRLRTMGLARRQGRRLLLVELAPLITVAIVTGGAVGLVLPQLIAPALGLTTFTDGFDAGITINLGVVGGAIGLVLAGLGTALLVETMFNRRMRLGEVLRLGGES